MTETDDQGLRFLKIVLAMGGCFEIIMGLVMFFFIRVFFSLIGAEEEITYMIYPRCMGVLATAFGLLMLVAARDPARYIGIPLVSIILRVLIQIPIILGILEMPEMALPLIGFGITDLVFAIITAIGIIRAGIDWRSW